MLPPITRRYFDHSTLNYFEFSFLCDNCGLPWKSERYPFSLGDTADASECEKPVFEMLWKAEHEAAYERANNEAAFHFNKCPGCGRRVCDECFSLFDDVCNECAGADSTGP